MVSLVFGANKWISLPIHSNARFYYCRIYFLPMSLIGYFAAIKGIDNFHITDNKIYTRTHLPRKSTYNTIIETVQHTRGRSQYLVKI